VSGWEGQLVRESDIESLWLLASLVLTAMYVYFVGWALVRIWTLPALRRRPVVQAAVWALACVLLLTPSVIPAGHGAAILPLVMTILAGGLAFIFSTPVRTYFTLMALAVATAALIIGGLIRWRLAVRARAQSDAASPGTPWGTNHDYAAIVCAAVLAFVLVTLAHEERDDSYRATEAMRLDAMTPASVRDVPALPPVAAPHQIQILGAGTSGQALQPAGVAPLDTGTVEITADADE
jgi:hypothetical protein